MHPSVAARLMEHKPQTVTKATHLTISGIVIIYIITMNNVIGNVALLYFCNIVIEHAWFILAASYTCTLLMTR